MRDLQAEIAARLARYDSDIGGSDHAAIAIQFVGDLRAILAECAEGDIGDATLPLMPTSKRTVTLREEPAPMFAGDPSGGGSNLPAPKRYRCRACEQEFDSKVGMHREHITDIDGSWCSGIVEETP